LVTAPNHAQHAAFGVGVGVVLFAELHERDDPCLAAAERKHERGQSVIVRFADLTECGERDPFGIAGDLATANPARAAQPQPLSHP
jgi:hypothetical protein